MSFRIYRTHTDRTQGEPINKLESCVRVYMVYFENLAEHDERCQKNNLASSYDFIILWKRIGTARVRAHVCGYL